MPRRKTHHTTRTRSAATRSAAKGVGRRAIYRQTGMELCEERRVLASSPLLIDLNPAGNSNPSDFVELGNFAYFVAENATAGRELWRTDGTTVGTKLVKDIRGGTASSNPTELTVYKNALYFVADDGVNGQELWKSDGTESGTVLLKDIYPGQGNQAPYGSGPFRSLPQDLTVVGGKLFFSAIDATNGRELWVSDGTATGTVLVEDILTGTGSGATPLSSNPSNLTNVNGTLFFTANDGTAGVELWKSDGTAAGTLLIADLFAGTTTVGGQTVPNASEPSQLTAVGSTLYFTASDATNGRELWKSNGTAAGTTLVKDIRTGSAASLTTSDVLMNVNGTLFFSADEGASGRELWKTDGTAAGTLRVKDILSGATGGVTLGKWAVLGNNLYFTANDGSVGTELWKSDGTEAGTVLVRDVDGAATSSLPQALTVVGNRLYFSAATTAGREAWETDGTSAGTKTIGDIANGSASSSPDQFAALKGLVLFAANDSAAGQELRVADVDGQINARIKIVVDGQEVTIPNGVGVAVGGARLSQVRTTDATGNIRIEPVTTEPLTQLRLGDFFTTWRTNGGQAGNNAAANLSATQLMGSTANTTKTVKMMVNGQVSTNFENYVLRDGDQIVLVYGANPVVSVNTNFGPLVMELFLDQKPITVDNFLSYINDNSYINTFFHRSAKNGTKDFVIQAGGFRTNSPTFTSTAQFTSVPSKGQIQNEPGISNLRGTVAMAKLGGQPNSATNQWFVNLSNDNSSLDSAANNAFTVFAEVLDLTTVDTIAALSVNKTNPEPYNELPLGSNNQLVVVQSITGLGRIHGTTYRDTNSNSQKDTGEAGIANATVFIDANANNLFDTGELSTATDANGNYIFEVQPGTYLVRTVTAAGDVVTEPLGASKSYSVTVDIGRDATGRDFGVIGLAAPTSVDLVAASDAGTSDSDNLTNRNNSSAQKTLQFLVSGVTSGAEVRIFADAIQIGTATATGSTVTVTTNGIDALTAGPHEFRAVQVSGGTASATSPALTVTIDNTPPASFSNTAPITATVGTLYSFDVNSPDETAAGVVYSLANQPTGMTINATGLVNWTPTASQAVPQSFEIRLTDAAGNATVQTVNLTVLSSLPAFPDTFNTTEDTVLTVALANSILNNDGGSNPGTLTASVVQTTTHGTLQLNPNGTFTYTPTANYFGTDTFTYKANNGTQDSNQALVTIQIAGANDPTVTTPDTYSTNEDTVLTVAVANGVLANDTDVDNVTLTATVASQPTHGTLVLNTNGSFTYTPAAQYNGPDSFTYVINDGTANSAPVQVSLTVTAVNDAPTGVADTYTVNEDTVLTVNASNGVLKNDTDPEGTTLSAKIQTSPANGTVVLNADGSFTYTPKANFSGSDTFSYRASDSALDSAVTTVTITVVEQPDPPAATDDTFQVTTAGLLLNVLQNDTANAGTDTTLTLDQFTQGTNGTVTREGNQLRYVPKAGFTGTDTFTYTAKNSTGLSDSGTVTVTVTNTGGNRIAGFVYVDTDKSNNRATTEPGIPGVLITLSGTDSTGASVTRTTLSGNDGSYRFEDVPAGTYQVTQRQPSALRDGKETTAVTNAVAGEDKITNIVVTGANLYADNNFGEASLQPTYVTIAWFFASTAQPASVFRRMVATGEEKAGDLALAKQILEANSSTTSNTAPVATADTYTVAQGGTLTTTTTNGVLANDVDADQDPLIAVVATNPTNGTLTMATNGTFTYKPNATFIGTDTFTYTASDGKATSAARTVTISVGTAASTFTVAENSAAGATVGTVTASGTLSQPVLFDFQNASLNSALKLAPDDHLSNNAANPIVLIQYIDFQSPDDLPYNTIVKNLEQQYSSTLLVVRRHNPITATHPNALAAAKVAEAAGRQGFFNQMANLLFVNRDSWTASTSPDTLFNGYAQQLGLNMTKFAQDLADATLTARIQRDIDAAKSLGLTGTPAFYLNGQKIANPATESDFKDVIQAQVTAYNQPFRLDRLTGQLTVSGAAPLNFEQKASYPLVIDVMGSDRKTSTVNATVTITNVNEKPVGTADTYSVNEAAVLTVDVASGVLANDSDPEGNSLTATVVTNVANGTLTLSANGSFSYTPRAGFAGTDTFTYQAKDASLSADPTTVTITVVDVNLAPVAVADTYTTTEDNALQVAAKGVLTNDTDADGDTLTAELVTSVSKGQLTFNQNGSFNYTPNANVSGTDSFTYRVNDGKTTSSAVTVTINITAVNDAPVGVADQYSVNEDETLTVPVKGVLNNDTDTEGTALTAVLEVQPQHGALTLNSNGSFTYTPSANYNGADTFTYRASDGTATSAVTTVNITVNPVSDGATTVRNDQFRVDANGTLNVSAANGVLANDEVPAGDTLNIVLDTNVQHGTLTLNSNGSFIYTPTSGYRGTDQFKYKASNVAAAGIATVDLRIDSLPVATNDTYNATEDTVLTKDAATGVLSNDTDADANTLTATVVLQPTHGILQLNANGSFTYTPALNYNGTDSFQYRVNDGTSNSAAPATVNITIASVNDAPVGASDTYTMTEDNALAVASANGVLINDSDVDNATLTATLVTNVTHGSLTLNANGSFNYTPNANYNGTDSFVYRATDGTTSSADTTVNLTVTPTNDAPVANTDSYSIPAGTQLVIAANGVLANDTDIDNNTLTAAVAATTTHGTLSLNTNGGFTYTPTSGYSGPDSFTYRANDGTTVSELATVNIQVTAAPNQFLVAQASPAGTVIGTVQADSVTGSPKIFQVSNASLNTNLVLNADDHLSGDPSASVVMIEYLDFGCPHCKEAHPLVKQMEQEFAGQLLVVRRHLPIITSTSPNAARAAEAAARQNKFDEMSDLLFEKQTEWRAESDPQTRFESYATSLGLDLTQFKADYADPTVAARVTRDRTSGLAVGANSTPTFFVNGEQKSIAASASAYQSVIQTAISATNDVITLNRRTGEIKVLKPNGITTSVSPIQFTVNVSNASGNVVAAPIKITVTAPPPPASNSAPPSAGATATDAVFAAAIPSESGTDEAWYLS